MSLAPAAVHHCAAPYIGVHWLNRFGETADISRRGGGYAEDIAVVFGLRLWF